jgi:hypothetical protein
VSNFDKEFTGENLSMSEIAEQNLELINQNQFLFKDFFN